MVSLQIDMMELDAPELKTAAEVKRVRSTSVNIGLLLSIAMETGSYDQMTLTIATPT